MPISRTLSFIYFYWIHSTHHCCLLCKEQLNIATFFPVNWPSGGFPNMKHATKMSCSIGRFGSQRPFIVIFHGRARCFCCWWQRCKQQRRRQRCVGKTENVICLCQNENYSSLHMNLISIRWKRTKKCYLYSWSVTFAAHRFLAERQIRYPTTKVVPFGSFLISSSFLLLC